MKKIGINMFSQKSPNIRNNKNIRYKRYKRNNPNKLRKFNFLLKAAGITALAAIFIAAVLFTPLSGVLSSYLKNEAENAFKYEDNGSDASLFGKINEFIKFDKFNKFKKIDIGKALVNFSFSGINDMYDSQAASVFNENENETNSDVHGRRNDTISPYENIPATDDDSIISIQELYDYYHLASGAKIEEAGQDSAASSEIPQEYSNMYKITAVNMSGQKTKVPKLLINNQTSYNIDLYDYIERKYPIDKFDMTKTDEPVVLIVNTHTTESYVEEGTAYYYPPFTAERTTDPNKSVVLIAAQLKNKLTEYGIPVIQSTKLHDAVSFQHSYIRSLETVNEYLQKYPSIKYVIDLHRDSTITATGEKYKPTIKINGRDSSQIMFVIGTPEGGAHHPDWRDNLTFAAYLQKKMNDKYPMLARPINLRNARFNQHTTKASVILEVGSCGSTFSEALYAADLFGECMAELILEHN